MLLTKKPKNIVNMKNRATCKFWTYLVFIQLKIAKNSKKTQNKPNQINRTTGFEAN